MKRTDCVGLAPIFLLIVGCVTTQFTPTSYTRAELLRREAESYVKDGMSTYAVTTTMQENGFNCHLVKDGKFQYSTNVAQVDEPEGRYDFVLCERHEEESGLVAQVAVLLEKGVSTGHVLVRRKHYLDQE